MEAAGVVILMIFGAMFALMALLPLRGDEPERE